MRRWKSRKVDTKRRIYWQSKELKEKFEGRKRKNVSLYDEDKSEVKIETGVCFSV